MTPRLHLAAVCALWLTVSLPAWAGGFEPLYDFGSNPGRLWTSVYAPSKASAPATLIIALHGCLQSGRIYGLESGWSDLADRFGWVILLPEQPFTNNWLECFNWFDPTKAKHGGDEVVSIRQMITAVVARYHIDQQRIFITGLSAGGAMTAAMTADYPDLFAGAAVIAGVPFGCATNAQAAQKCLKPGRNRSPEAWAKQVRKAAPAPAAYPRLAVWQGQADDVVAPMNARELIEQWTAVDSIDLASGRSDTIKGLPRTTWANGSGAPVVQLVLVPGMRHAVPVNPGDTPESCGTIGSYAASVGICSSLEIARFWGIAPD